MFTFRNIIGHASILGICAFGIGYALRLWMQSERSLIDWLGFGIAVGTLSLVAVIAAFLAWSEREFWKN